MFRFEGRTALVSGASQGIGAATARALAARGARVVLAARNRERLDELVGEIEASGGRALALPLDLADPGSIESAVASLEGEMAAVDVLVNNAGVTDDGLLLRMSQEQWERVLRTNLTGTFVLTKALVRGMMKRRYGRIVTVSSVVGLMGNAGQANYAASKAGLVGFTKSIARELGSRGITANVVAPGFVSTAMTESLAESVKESMLQATSLGRFGSVDDVAAAVLFLASEEAGYVTGDVLNVSGGLYM
ncbi:MAG TPA: 3-oxoacyl-[acyl-carrier-protein] reductase [Thermoanaerobaculia bacterium]|nr:3-oxoacyl-[acyl-carrier-protein] reductase [Thermoanaerobaculia bacterium]